MQRSIHLIPQPKTVISGTGSISLVPTVGGDFPFFHETLADYVRRILGIVLTEETPGAIRFIADSAFPGEAYALYAEDGRAEIHASTPDGARNGMSTLLQLISAEKNGEVVVPAVRIEDAPDCAFRSIMVDLARCFRPLSYVLSYIDLCVLYKIPVLHLHFTDNENYTLPSRLFSALSTPGHHYKGIEIDALNRYAASRGIHLMPEIDVPGHCRAFCEGYGDIFGKDGIIAFTAAAIEAMQCLFCELCDMFPGSGRVHIGGDEAAIEKWTTDPACRDYALSQGIDFDMEDKRFLAERMLAAFVEKMAEAVLSKGRVPMAWEGFSAAVNGYVTRDVQIMSWENFYQTTPSLLDAGFTVVNSSWNPMYVVTSDTYWTQEDVFNWNIRTWEAVHPDSPYRDKKFIAPDAGQIIGGQLLAWGSSIAENCPDEASGIEMERKLIAERAPMLAENTWNMEKRRDYPDISAAYRKTDLIRKKIEGDFR
ncbi:MAG TPA: hypothetical protein DIW36_01090 [Ruminococcaceae bacterium]|nr:hypothetical protein [Oscillospiraceae bacterium]